ncbi:allantoate amidohydrolase [Frigoribacterium sp. Leaf172]|uniref:allantoate amidohydrolase n=1 Tax=Frigoribacterium sp. Leaf172 TaxID=1736285 RepID=UPI0006FF385D|nr:allantoate amidohydrolase [Frigoribacterium sp. Leaf172]KQR66376.1 Zn-dependent hydrolase [Frigoribacterium sp. Leaf172]
MSPDALTVLERCDVLAAVSSSGTGLTRVYLSPEHARVNELAAGWMQQAGMTTWLDAAGNQRGRYEGAEPGAPALLLGSHLDTVPDAGRYDGMLGVLLAIAVVERLNVEGVRLPFAVEVIAFGDEEGTRFGTALLGSRAVAGTWDADWWGLLDAEGVSLRDAFVAFGLDPEAVGDAAPPRDSVIGYLETHIEQGPYLEEADRALAVVSSIAGARRFELTMEGVAGHAGGVPFHRRHDALAGAAEVVLAVERIAREAGCIATVGRLEAFPGGVNVIPGLVEFSLDLRAEHDDRRDEVWAAIEAAAATTCAERGLVFTAHETHSAPAVVASPRLAEAVRGGIVSTGDVEPLTLFSKAGHDAMAIDALTDWAMLFVRCGNGGISHHPDEIVDAADVAVALDAFEATVRELAGPAPSSVGAT